ncbi:MAG: ankyrin repeat domain-containing protein [Gammaproteobacteria bacterium]|nr:ankyrin repeat domain-containing protein [Gammaproteobacteria bacterium]
MKTCGHVVSKKSPFHYRGVRDHAVKVMHSKRPDFQCVNFLSTRGFEALLGSTTLSSDDLNRLTDLCIKKDVLPSRFSTVLLSRIENVHRYLHVVVQRMNYDGMTYFVDNGFASDVLSASIKKNSAVYIDILRYIIITRGYPKKAIKSDLRHRLFLNACEQGDAMLVRFLIFEWKLSPTLENNSGLVIAAEMGHVHVVHFLLCLPKVKPSAQQGDAIRFAVQNGHTEVVELFAKRLKTSTRVLVNTYGSGGARWLARCW